MTASDNDVYVKSMDGYIDEIKQTRSQQQIATNNNKIMPSILSGLDAGNLKAPLLQINTPATATATASAPDEPMGVTAWGTSFERLLEDAAGLQTFAEFLKKEFSAENIYFWTACERFRHLENATERAAQALAIFSKHLANGALEPVNVDSQARNFAEEKLQSAEADMFAPAQKQIFNLMKFDSYQRFIRSDLYKSCLEAEEKQLPLPYGADDLDELLKTHFQQNNTSKLKKSASNAEDRRRKSLLPWHRKTRCKSRDRNEVEIGKTLTTHSCSKLPQLSGNSLRIPSTHNSVSDIHSSRSSLSSFDALPAALNQTAEVACSLCRVILSDGATTIVQTRSDETVAQLVERLLEKRGLSYQYYDVVPHGSTKSVDLQSPAQILAGKEVLIEHRVAFKLDLPDPKVISVKSKPKKQLHEVIRPILHKYNYSMEGVQVLLRDTHAQLDLSLPVTVADGQRLQIVLSKPALNADHQNGGVRFTVPKLLKPSSGSSAAGTVRQNSSTPQSTLDEITNKVFNELLQGKVEAHAVDSQLPKAADLCSLKSDDCASETSSIFDRMRKRDANIPTIKFKPKKKSTSSQHSEDANQNSTNILSTTTGSVTMPQTTTADLKKPIIAKLKAGVKLQVTERVAENQDALLEGLKRAQLARLEDQRGTEINFELPEFLKNKENLSAAASKLRKVRANLSPVNKMSTSDETPTPHSERPQPAPRFSITNKNKSASNVSRMKIDEEAPSDCHTPANTSHSSLESDYAAGGKGPPPLPPKPKVLPIKPSNWGASATGTSGTPPSSTKNSPTAVSPTAINNGLSHSSKIPIDIGRKSQLSAESTARCAYLEEPSSSFV